MRLLIVGTLQGHITTAGHIAMQRGAKVAHVQTIDQAMISLRSGKGADMVMVDIHLNIGDFIQRLRQERITVPVVACGVEDASGPPAEAIRAGAQEYIPLPPDPDLIAAVLEAVTQEDETVIYRDPVTQKLFKLVDQIAPTEASVLITGESGTGKEVVARYIHKHSKRFHCPFISVNCAAIPETLLESELFGHEKGAFTGAVARRIGKFEEANGGTLLLDEISEMNPLLQAKLLRVLQERELDRVGGRHPVKVDIRILATSNRQLTEEVKKGNFREDLYFRLNVVSVHLAPLRQRPADIEVLAQYFGDKYATLNHLPKRRFSPQAYQKLVRYEWPGNVRELENTIHRATILAPGPEIGADSIFLSHEALGSEGDSYKARGDSSFLGRTVADMEKELILTTLNHCLGNRTQAAHILGISIRTLRNKLKQYREDTPEGLSSPLLGASEMLEPTGPLAATAAYKSLF